MHAFNVVLFLTEGSLLCTAGFPVIVLVPFSSMLPSSWQIFFELPSSCALYPLISLLSLSFFIHETLIIIVRTLIHYSYFSLPLQLCNVRIEKRKAALRDVFFRLVDCNDRKHRRSRLPAFAVHGLFLQAALFFDFGELFFFRD